MKTKSAAVSGTASIPFTGICPLRTLAGILALFLAATFAAGCGKAAQDEAKPASGKAAHDEAKPASGETAQDEAKPASGENALKESGAEHEDYQKGIAAFEQKDFAEAVKLFRAGAEKGDTEAMLMLSFCLEHGKGVEEDEDESIQWGKKAADTGHPLAQAMYGTSLLSDDSEKEGIAYLKKSAAQDCIVGQYILGMHCLMDSDSKLLKVEGVKHLKKAAGTPLTDERNVLDYAKDDDTKKQIAVFGLPPDTTATSLCIILSQFTLGSAYMQGNGVRQDFAEARKWLALARDNGLPQAGVLLKQLDDLEKTDAPAALGKNGNVSVGEAAGDGPGQDEFRSGLAAYDKKDFAEAVKLFRAGAEQGSAEAQMLLSYCLDEGIGTEKDKEASHEWMKKAADAGNPVAQASYAGILMTEKKIEEALEYAKRSAAQGCVSGQLVLGVLLLASEDAAEAKQGVAYLTKIANLPLTDRISIEDYLMDDDDRSHFSKPVTAANGTIHMAQFFLGRLCLGAADHDRDIREAMKWFRKSADGGLKDAKDMLEVYDR